MDVTIRYGRAARRTRARPVFVVRGSEALAALGDEGWDEVERGFFVAGAVLEEQPARPPPTPARLSLPRLALGLASVPWRWVAVWGAGLALSVLAVVAAAVPRGPDARPGAAAASPGLPRR
jgi:hypothetical protein